MGLWNTIRKGWDAINNKFSFILGDGRRVKFWKGRWYGLAHCVTTSKDSWVANV